MPIPDNLKTEILTHADSTAPNEACGLVVLERASGEMSYFPCDNIAADPRHFFEISPEDFIRAEERGEIVAVVHSHPDSEEDQGLPYLSTADRECQVRSKFPFWLVVGNEIKTFRPIPPLLGRKFKNTVQDCRTLCLDAYMLAGLDIEKTQAEYDFDWFEQGHNFYEAFFTQSDFYRLAQDEVPQLGDVVLLQIGSPVPNHAGIYLGEQMMLHHSLNRLSARVPYDGAWLDQTHSIWRYKQWQQLSFTAILKDLQISLSN